jgi:predicted regulator of Ras-like GTPase activity (Roadblock/LC7/MglB family)
VRAVDAAQALAELAEISSQIEAAAIVDDQGNVLGTTGASGDGLAAAGSALFERAARVRGSEPAQLEVSSGPGSVFVVRGGGGRTIVARTAPDPTVGLVFYDLENCLRNAT